MIGVPGGECSIGIEHDPFCGSPAFEALRSLVLACGKMFYGAQEISAKFPLHGVSPVNAAAFQKLCEKVVTEFLGTVCVPEAAPQVSQNRFVVVRTKIRKGRSTLGRVGLRMPYPGPASAVEKNRIVARGGPEGIGMRGHAGVRLRPSRSGLYALPWAPSCWAK